MTITAQIIADSISPEDIRLTTMQLRYPRFIHSEFMTHRHFSRNASSSRAIPVKRMIEDIRRDPAMPVYWGSNKPGMQAGEELNELEIQFAKSAWLSAMDDSIKWIKNLIDLGLHKQIANRLLEPWAHINVVVTATEWKNFFELRRHPDAQPEIKALADAMWDAMEASTPELHHPEDWHLPYITREEWKTIPHEMETLRKVSVARCARVSYLTHDGRPTTIEEDIALYEKLVVAKPLHASPAEHQAKPDQWTHVGYQNEYLHGNFNGWIQFRKVLETQS